MRSSKRLSVIKIDFLDLLKQDGNWLIVNRMYATLSEE